jgi:triosephosphate isomerase
MDPARGALIAGNWKMNGRLADAKRWAEAAGRAAAESPHEVAVFPPFPWLLEVGRQLAGRAALGGQTCHPEPYGAYTGSVSAAMLKEAGCTYVLCGHSERRTLAHETDETVRAQAEAVVKEGLVPVVCVGETLAERRAMKARAVVVRQVESALTALRGPEDPLVIAYEPVWAIGTGVTATPEEAAEAHGWVRATVAARDPDRARALRILYGGSVNPGNMGRLLAVPDVDGALAGGASLDPEAFARLATAQPS